MSKSLTQLRIDTAIKFKQEQELKDKQAKCRHDFLPVPSFDFEYDDVYYFAVCRRCGFKTE